MDGPWKERETDAPEPFVKDVVPPEKKGLVLLLHEPV
jgi:hypothetical protein